VSEVKGRIGLADYLAGIRAELDEAQRQAAHDDLRLGVEEITVELDVAYTVSVTGEASAGIKAKFWVLEIGEASAKAGTEWDRARTQRLTLTLRPRVEQAVTDGTGTTKITTRGLDVSGALAAGEESPRLSTTRPADSPGD
jgi:hypothetical protein